MNHSNFDSGDEAHEANLEIEKIDPNEIDDGSNSRLSIRNVTNLALPVTVFTVGSIGPTFYAVIISGSNFITAKILSLGGATDLAASGLITSVLLLQRGFLHSPMNAVNVISGEGVAHHDVELVNASIQHGMTLSALSSIPLMLSSAFVGPILTATGQDSDIADAAQEYFNGYLWGMYADAFLIATQQHALATNHAYSVYVSTIFQKTLNLSLGYCLMEGKLGLPEMGLYGVGVSASVAALATFAGLNAYLIARKKILLPDILNLKKAYTERLSMLVRLLKEGLPISIRAGFDLASLALMLQISGLLGETELIAAEVTQQYYGLALIPVIGASNTANSCVSMSLISDHPQDARRYANIAYTAAVIPQIITIAMCLAYKPLTDFFINSADMELDEQDEILQQTLAIFIINAFAISFDHTRNISMHALQGLFDTAVPTGVNSAASVLSIVGSYLAGITFGLGNTGIYSIKAVSAAAVASILIPRWILKIRNHTVTDEVSDRYERIINLEKPVETEKISENNNTFWNSRSNLSSNEEDILLDGHHQNEKSSWCNLM